jgi:hypothetical protein
VIAYPQGAVKMTFTDLLVSSVLAPSAPVTLGLGDGFEPRSARLGIIAILIGLQAQPALSLSFQDGDDIILKKFNGATLTTVAREKLPPQASGLIEEEGIGWFYVQPEVDDQVYAGAIGHAAEPILTVGH